jgi:hypothetical protein
MSNQWRCRSYPTNFPSCTPGISENHNDRSSRRGLFGHIDGSNSLFSLSFWVFARCVPVVLPFFYSTDLTASYIPAGLRRAASSPCQILAMRDGRADLTGAITAMYSKASLFSCEKQYSTGQETVHIYLRVSGVTSGRCHGSKFMVVVK